MQKHEYDIMVNKNTIRCWLIIAVVLATAYFIETIKGLRTIEYVIIFVTVMILPLIITVSTYCFDESSRFIKMEFAIGYCAFYTFVVFTTQSPAAFVKPVFIPLAPSKPLFKKRFVVVTYSV